MQTVRSYSLEMMAENVKKIKDAVSIDEALTLTGYGRFHYELLFVGALSIASVGFQNALAAYTFPGARCEHALPTSHLGLLNVAFLIGGVFGGLIWGSFADTRGRRTVLVIAHLLDATLTTFCALNPFATTLIIGRVFSGFLIAAPGSVIFSYIAEFQPPHHRNSVICYSGLFFTISWLLMPILAGAILPLKLGLNLEPFFVMNSWRLLVLIVAIIEMITGFCFLRLPESPKYLLAVDQKPQALEVLKKIYYRNLGDSTGEYPVVKLRKQSDTNCCGVWQQIQTLFKSPLRKITSLTSIIMFSNMFGVFGLGLWFPDLFAKLQEHQSLHFNQTTAFPVKNLKQITQNTCEPAFDSTVITNTIVIGLCALLGNVLSGWLASRVRLRTISLVTMLMGGFSALTFYWLQSEWENLVMASLFQSAMITANMTLGCVCVELFPAQIGAMAICLVMCAGRLGAIASNAVFALWADEQCEIAVFIVAVCVIIGGFACIWIPIPQNSDNENSDELKHTCRRIEIAVITTNFQTRL